MEIKVDKKYQKRNKTAKVKAKEILAVQILETFSGLKSDIKELKQYI